MGTALTGLEIKDTYDGLVKTTDNGPISGTAKYLSDGLGNDSILALSTTALGIGTASPTSLAQLNGTAGTAHLRVSEAGATIGFLGGANGIISGATGSMALRAEAGLVLSSQGNAQTMTLTSAGNVGIGTSTPEAKLHVAGTASGSDVTLYIDNAAVSALNNSSRLKFSSDAGSSVSNGGAELNCLNVSAGNGAVDLLVKSWTGGAYTEKARFLAGGGLTFNGDTLEVNALDDYEEGTWTMGIAFGGASVGATYVNNTGRYTKIGRQVTASGYLALSDKGSSTGDATITGLPFANAAIAEALVPILLRLDNVSFTNTFQGFLNTSVTNIALGEITILGVASNLTNADFQNGSSIMVSVTYTV